MSYPRYLSDVMGNLLVLINTLGEIYGNILAIEAFDVLEPLDVNMDDYLNEWMFKRQWTSYAKEQRVQVK
ncbi:hypothetical protein SLS59_008332 [Nothophoma quercina]|uniref:Uncharacterized protein n=1 Tax=Nothophoma quercina TaxID=749835 RepID=A0ABR3QTC0_9PLEO